MNGFTSFAYLWGGSPYLTARYLQSKALSLPNISTPAYGVASLPTAGVSMPTLSMPTIPTEPSTAQQSQQAVNDAVDYDAPTPQTVGVEQTTGPQELPGLIQSLIPVALIVVGLYLVFKK